MCKSLQSYSGLTAKTSQFDKVINSKEYKRLGQNLYSYFQKIIRALELPNKIPGFLAVVQNCLKSDWAASMGMVGTGAM